MKNRNVLAALILCVALCLSLVACEGGEKGEENSISIDNSQDTSASSEVETPDIATDESITPVASFEMTPPPERIEGHFYFRDTVWGMTKDHVVDLEGEPFEEINEEGYLDLVHGLVYENVPVSGYSVTAYFYFDKEGLLYNGSYSFALGDGDYGALADLLVEKYGEPTEETHWESPYGVLYDSFYTRWVSADTEVNLSLSLMGVLGASIDIGYRDLVLYEKNNITPEPPEAPPIDGSGL
jgi:hypothetical protein